MPFWVYILQSEANSKIYIGQTSDLNRRLLQHNDPDFRLTLYTKRNAGPWKLVHSEQYTTRTEAMQREKWLKSGQGREWTHRLLQKRERGTVNPPAADTRVEDPP